MVIAAQAGSLIRINGRDLPLSTPIGLSKPLLIGHSMRWRVARLRSAVPSGRHRAFTCPGAIQGRILPRSVRNQRASEMDADIQFKITVFGLSALSTILVSAVLFAL